MESYQSKPVNDKPMLGRRATRLDRPSWQQLFFCCLICLSLCVWRIIAQEEFWKKLSDHHDDMKKFSLILYVTLLWMTCDDNCKKGRVPSYELPFENVYLSQRGSLPTKWLSPSHQNKENKHIRIPLRVWAHETMLCLHEWIRWPNSFSCMKTQ